MAKSLVITEKPSVARDIAAALGGFTEHEGYAESDRYVVTFAVGHLLELLEPDEIDPAYKRWTLDNLPIVPQEFRLKVKSGQTERVRTIKKLVQRDDVSELINACDAGREGELIFREIVKHLGATKPIRRLWLQSMTDEAIRGGFRSLRAGVELEGLAAAAECRSFADWLIGMNATRALTKRLKSRREKTAWSAGRVQTPTLALLVDRELEVVAHVPRPYWRVTAAFEHDGSRYAGVWFDPAFRESDGDGELRDDRIFDEARARAVVEASQARPGLAEETRKPSRESAPPLFDLTSLQREGNRRFGWSAKRTLGAAQRCYEAHKILTYPRTDSRCLPTDYRATVRGVLESFAHAGRSEAGGALAEYGEGAARLLDRGLENQGRIFDDAGISDHFAIIPTGVLPGPSLSGDDRRLFDLVVRRFLGAFHPPALWVKVERTTQVGGERFRTRARSLQEPGWRAVLATEPEEDEASLPPLRPGVDEVSDVAVETREVAAEQQETKPPARITEARLLSLMENAGQQIEDESLAVALHEKGIGTPATRADIIENLIAKGYATRVGKALRPTVKGIRLIDVLRRVHIDRLASAALTGELEKHLGEVEHGQRSAAQFMSEIEAYAREIVEHAKSFEYEALYANEAPLGPCPRTGRPVKERAWFYSADEDPAAGEDAPTPMLFWKDTSGRYINREVVEALLREGKTGVLDGFTARDGRTYKGTIEIDRDAWRMKVRSAGPGDGESASASPEYDVNPAPLGLCPSGEDCRVVESPTHFVCERKLEGAEAGAHDGAPKGCGFQLPRTVCKREITRDEALYYLQNRRTELLTDFTSRFGRPFSATLVLKENGRHGFEFPPREKKPGTAGGRFGKKTTKKDGEQAASDEALPPRKAARTGGPRKTAARKPRKATARAPIEGATTAAAQGARKKKPGSSAPGGRRRSSRGPSAGGV